MKTLTLFLAAFAAASITSAKTLTIEFRDSINGKAVVTTNILLLPVGVETRSSSTLGALGSRSWLGTVITATDLNNGMVRVDILRRTAVSNEAGLNGSYSEEHFTNTVKDGYFATLASPSKDPGLKTLVFHLKD